MAKITMLYGHGDDPNVKGVSYSRLWTNDDPTASYGAMDCTLSEAATAFDALRIVWAYNTSAGATEDNWQDEDVNAMAYIYDIRNKRDLIVSGSAKMNLGATLYAASYAYARRGYFTADDSVHFTTAYRFNAEGSNTSLLIPLVIDGVNF